MCFLAVLGSEKQSQFIRTECCVLRKSTGRLTAESLGRNPKQDERVCLKKQDCPERSRMEPILVKNKRKKAKMSVNLAVFLEKQGDIREKR